MTGGNAEEHLARLQSLMEGLERDVRQAGRELAESQEARAEDARSGRLGPDWQAVQRRIDNGTTTLADVFTGGDDSPEAIRLRELSQQNLTQLAVEFEPPPEVETELAAAELEWAALNGETPTDDGQRPG
jgi:hypothetical protein